MTAALFSWGQPAPSYQHASAEAYAAFLREYLGASRSIPIYLRMREQFIQAYPDLQTWFAAPLTERIGRLYGESDHAFHMLHRPSYLARAYLYYLVPFALTGTAYSQSSSTSGRCWHTVTWICGCQPFM